MPDARDRRLSEWATLAYHLRVSRCAWIRDVIEERMARCEEELETLTGERYAHDSARLPAG